ncbi:phospholipid-transporting ATPase VA [Phascolarctos cinereus]|uniref:Phospholipid-transporting ATPase n=1 Tax=Phascolarctos cinereus TaxID=38626 RepID=A0A6P5KYF6_PHACI|nr:probable phospholipid-transporting ATPase VA isoform X1 [Phascolarctos cinereus]
MGTDGGARRKETAAREEGDQGQEEPRRHRQQQRHRRRRESKTRTVRSNLLPPPGGGEPDVATKGAPHRWWWSQGGSQYLADNRLKTTKYTVLSFLPKNLFEQFHRLANVYFVLIALFNFVPVLNAFQPELALAPVLFILAVTAIKDLWEDYSRHRSDHEINHLDCLVYCRDEKKFVNRYWKEVRVGDFVQLRCNEIIPADILLLSSSDPDGLCHIETANLDGETNLKQRQVVREFLELDAEFNPLKFTSIIECEKPNNDLSRFRGNIIHENGKKAALYKENLLLRGCTIRNTEEVTGIVIYAGHETKALLNNSGPRYKRSKLERQMNMDVLWCVLILIVMCLFSAVGHGLWVRQYGERKKPLFDVPQSDGSDLSPVLAAVYLFLTMIIVLQVLIPISLYVSIEIVKICQVFFIHQDKELYDEETDSKLQCRALNITEDLGQIQYIFSDKTGTLTENKMIFRRCTVSGIEYSHDANARRIAMYQEADSEEDEAAPKGGTLSQRGSIGSHQSVKVVHRTQSTKSHRRTGSRAEAKRASILSKHTAFSSPMEKDITPDPKLFEKVNECARCLEIMRNQEKSLSHLTPELADIFDFFIALTICNTVVVTAPNQPRHKVRVRFELKSPVKTIEDFIRRFTPSRLTSGSNSGSSSSLSTSKSTHKTGSSFLSTLSTESTLLKLEAGLTRSSPKMNTNGYGVQPGGGWATENGLKEGELRYEAESPDEAALVYAARAYNCSLVGRLPDQVSVELPYLGRLTFELLHTLGFDSIRKRMSVVIRHPLTDEINVYTKGADSVMMDLLLPCSSDDSRGKHQKKIQSKTQNYLNFYAADGLRTLCIAKKVLSKEEYACWLQSHLEAESSLENRDELLFQSAIRLETNLHLLGATGIEDRLQDGVPETIANLRQAGLQIWVLTGDKQETAVNIAYACKLLDHDEEIITLNAESQETCAALLEQCLYYVESKFSDSEVKKSLGKVNVGVASLHPPSPSAATCPNLGLVIDGKTLAYALDKTLEDKFLSLARRCRSVLCCRSTPLQKSMVVKLVRNKLKAMTLAIGDGANDVSMIQVADVGVGISGQEGMQAVMASDFAVPRFRQLEKLLLVHGHWCYSRLANMVLYFFYKNAMFVALLFWYQFYCGFSASSMIDQWFLIFFNLLFSSLPQLITGVLDKDVPAEILVTVPQLYKSGQNTEEYQPYMFWMNMIDATYQSLVCFFIPYFAYHDSDVDIFSWGTVITTIALFTIILHLGIETKTWTWLHWTACSFSILIFFIVALVYNASCSTCFPPSNPYWTMQRLMGDPMFYLTTIISSVVALLPRFLYRTFQGTLFPTQLQLGRQLARWGPKEFSVHKDTISQQHPVGEQGLESTASKGSDTSGPHPQDHSPLASQSGHQPASVTESRSGHRTANVNAQSLKNTVMDSLRGHSPVPQRPEGAVQEGPPGDSEGESSTREVSPLSSILDLPDFSLLNWISSTPLFNGFGRAFRFSQSSLQTDVLGSTFFSIGSQLDQDLKGLKRETSDCFQEKVKGTAAVCHNSENLETTFL